MKYFRTIRNSHHFQDIERVLKSLNHNSQKSKSPLLDFIGIVENSGACRRGSGRTSPDAKIIATSKYNVSRFDGKSVTKHPAFEMVRHRTRRPHGQAEYVIILSDDEDSRPRKRVCPTTITISSDDDEPKPKKACVQQGTEKKTAAAGREEERLRTDTVAVEKYRNDLMRSWVDIGIQMAIRELNPRDVSAKPNALQ